MQKSGRWAILPMLTGAALLVAGCATQEEINELRAAVSGAQSTAEAAEQRAASAAGTASEAERRADAAELAAKQAAADAAAAAEKADRVYQQSLRK